jgi:D-alanyl-D-alanine carboxypeptidase
MNKKARAMGTRRTRFYTPSGLDRKSVFKKRGKRLVKITSNVSTAREIARIARLAFANKTIRSICLKKRYVMASTKSKGGYRIKNTNKLLRGNLPIEGGKTGYTSRAGHCLATKFTPGRNILLIVVLGSPDHFRDTRLVYRKALKKSKSAKTKSRSRRTHHRNRSAGPVSG